MSLILQTSWERPKSAPTQGSKEKIFLSIQKDTIAKISSILQYQKLPEGIRIRREHFFRKFFGQKSQCQKSFTLAKRFFQAKNITFSKV